MYLKNLWHILANGWNIPDVLPIMVINSVRDDETAASTASKKLRRGGSLYHWPLASELWRICMEQ